MFKFGENNEVIREEQCNAILAGLELREDISRSMEELAGLAEAAGASVLGIMIQRKEAPDKATLLGKGKVEELRELCANMEADTVIFNEELSGMQLRNLEAALSVRVIDRTILILDIFAARAISREGKLQVELAQLQYRMPRLVGFGKSLSRLGGGIGTRGPGEKKLETDRRHIASRMEDIRAEMAQIKGSRSVQRARREKSDIPVVALAGYTNSGKSALMNRMLADEESDKTVLEKNMLFATLDTAQRLIRLDTGRSFILIDTVGFVDKLPHSLIQAFKATLEEVTFADLILQVVDGSFESCDFHIEVTNRVLKEIGAGDKERVILFNKMDLADGRETELLAAAGSAESLFISARTGYNIDALTSLIREKLFSDRVTAKLLFPFDRGDLVSYLCGTAHILSTAYTEDGTLLTAELTAADYGRFREYVQI